MHYMRQTDFVLPDTKSFPIRKSETSTMPEVKPVSTNRVAWVAWTLKYATFPHPSLSYILINHSTHLSNLILTLYRIFSVNYSAEAVVSLVEAEVADLKDRGKQKISSTAFTSPSKTSTKARHLNLLSHETPFAQSAMVKVVRKALCGRVIRVPVVVSASPSDRWVR